MAEEWRAEYARIHALLSSTDENDRDEGRWQLTEFYALVDEETAAAALTLYYRAYELGTRPDWTADLDQRLAFLERASRAVELTGNQDAAADCYDQMGRQLMAVGRRREARARLEEALVRLPDAVQGRPVILLTLAELDRQLGAYSAALEHAVEAEESLPEGPEWDAVRAALAAIRGQIFVDLGMPDVASEWIEKRLSAAEEAWSRQRGNERELAEARYQALVLKKSVGHHTEVLRRVDELLAQDDFYTTRPIERARLFALKGTSCLRQEEDDADAPRVGAELLRQAIELGLDESLSVYARLALAEEALRLAEYALADGSLRAARATVDGWSTDQERRPPTAEAADLATLEVRLALDRGDDEARLRQLEPRIHGAMERLLEHWRGVPRRAGGVGYLLYGRRRALLGEIVRLTLRLEQGDVAAERALEQVFRAQALGTRARDEDVLVPTLNEVRQKLVTDRGGLLVYLPATGQSHVFAVDRDEVVHAELPASTYLEPQRRAWYSQLLTPAAALELDDSGWIVDEERRLAAIVSDMLFPPAVQELLTRWSEVAIVGQDSLGPLPFEWLPWSQGDHLGADLAMSYLPSIPLAVRWSDRPAPRERRLDYVLVGGVEPHPSVGERWPELAEFALSDATIDGLRGAYEPDRSQVLSAGAATREALAGIGLDEVRVLQFLVHGVLESGRERPAGLILSSAGPGDDGLFRCEDAEASRAPDVVLLTACRSGQGPTRRGDPGIADLGGAWLAAGARGVLASHTDLTLDSARSVSNSVHRALVEEGASLAEALRGARRAAVAEYGNEAPFRQGLLYVTGMAHEPVFANRSQDARDSPAQASGEAALGLAALAGVVLGAFVTVILIGRRPGISSDSDVLDRS